MFEINHEDEITTISLSHGKVNAMDLELTLGIVEQLGIANENSECQAVVLAGNGRIFSAGVDLKRLVSEPPSYLEEFLPSLINAFDAALGFPKPIVAAMNGHAVAGGCILACACDYRVANPKAKIGIPELRVGVPLPTVAIEIMRLVAAPSHFRQLVNLGATYSGEAAVEVGLADRLESRDDLMSAAIAKAKELADIPPQVFEVTKQQIRSPAATNIERGEQLFRERVFELWRSEEIREVIRAYVGKRL